MAYFDRKELVLNLGSGDRKRDDEYFGNENYFTPRDTRGSLFFSNFDKERRPTRISLESIRTFSRETLKVILRSYKKSFLEREDLEYADRHIDDILKWYFYIKDCVPFYNLAQRLDRYGDKYFFLWLAQDQTLFETTFFDTLQKRFFYQPDSDPLYSNLKKRRVTYEIPNVDLKYLESRKIIIDRDNLLVSRTPYAIYKFNPNINNVIGKLDLEMKADLEVLRRHGVGEFAIRSLNEDIQRTQGRINKLAQYRDLTMIDGVVICGGYIHSLITGAPYNDIDIFLIRESKQQNDKQYIRGKVREIEEVLDKTLINNGHTLTDYPTIQVIKRLYNSLDEILLGFDLDSSACAMQKGKFIVTDRYMNAAVAGINIVNPYNQSTTFNIRLRKYIKKGFIPYLPGAPHMRRIEYYQESSKDPKIHQLSGLLRDDLENIKKTSSESYGNLYTYVRYYRSHRGVNEEMEKGIKDLLQTAISGDYTIPEGMTLSQISNDVQANQALLNQIFFSPIAAERKILGWMVQNSGTQLTSSFNPTKVDYYSLPERQEKVQQTILENWAYRGQKFVPSYITRDIDKDVLLSVMKKFPKYDDILYSYRSAIDKKSEIKNEVSLDPDDISGLGVYARPVDRSPLRERSPRPTTLSPRRSPQPTTLSPRRSPRPATLSPSQPRTLSPRRSPSRPRTLSPSRSGVISPSRFPQRPGTLSPR